MTLPAGSSDDLIFRALIQDDTVRFFDQFDKRIDKLDNTARQGFSKVEGSIDGIGAALGIVGGVVGAVTVQLLNMAAQGVAAFRSWATEAVNLRARADTLLTVVELVGKNAGYSSEELAQFEEDLKATGITTLAARQSLVRMARANIDLAESAKLARIAQNSAVVAGIDSSQAFERLVRGIQKREPELLDELGIQLSRTNAYKALADELGKNVKQLTLLEQQQAILNDIYRQSEVVAGAYEGAMDTVGKKMTSTRRYSEELQLAVGGIFQEALFAQTEFIQQQLKDMAMWFEENSDQVQEMTEFVGRAARALFDFLDHALEVLPKIPGKFKDIGVSIAEIIVNLADLDVKVDETSENLGTSFLQAVSIIGGAANAYIQALSDGFRYIQLELDLVKAVLSGDFEGAEDLLREAIRIKDEELSNFGARLQENFEKGTLEAAIFFGIVDDGTRDVEKFAKELEVVGSALKDAADILAPLNEEFEDLFDKMQEQIFEDAIKEARRLEEEAIRLSHKREDIERSYQEKIKDIREGADDDNAKLAEDHAESLIDIEKDFQRRMRDLRERFEFEASELARKRDAVGLLRLMRRHKEEVRNASQNLEDQKSDERSSYQERLKEQEDSLQEQLKRADDARKKQYEDLARSLEREAQIRELHRRWEAEDRQRAFEKELAELGEKYSEIEGVTVSHIDHMLGYWSQYLGNLSAFREAFVANYNAIGNAAARVADAGRPSGEQVAIPGSRDASGGLGSQGRGSRIGQGGQVSSLLADPAKFMSSFSNMVPQVPAVGGGGGGSKRIEAVIRVEGDQLVPLVQRQIVQVVGEVFRNNA